MALLPFGLMLVFVIGGSTIFELPLQFTLLLSVLTAGIVAYFHGIKVDQMIDGIGQTLRKAMPAILILLAIGGIVGTWMYSGTVPYLIYYGLQLIHPDYLLVTAFIVTALLSTFTGTSWGSAATAGVAFMGIGTSMGVPVEMIAGAVVSGAVFGDKVSPVSDTTNICALSVEVSVYEHIRGMLPNMILASIAAIVCFTVLGLLYSGQAAEVYQVQEILNDLDAMYAFNPIMLLPPAIVFIGGFKGYPPVVLMLSSCFVAILMGFFLNGFDFQFGAKALISGFHVDMAASSGFDSGRVSTILPVLLNRGGFEGMMSGAILYCILAVSFGSIMEQVGGIHKIMHDLLKGIRSSFGLVLTAFGSGALLNGISGNATFSILTIGPLFRDGFKERELPLPLLSRSMENSMTLLESLIPWHVTALFMAATLGVNTLDYAPYAFFNMLGIALFFLLSYRTVKILNRTIKTRP